MVICIQLEKKKKKKQGKRKKKHSILKTEDKKKKNLKNTSGVKNVPLKTDLNMTTLNWSSKVSNSFAKLNKSCQTLSTARIIANSLL